MTEETKNPKGGEAMRPVAASVYIETIDGRMYGGATVQEALDALRAAAWGSAGGMSSRQKYMDATAQRVIAWNKRVVRTGSVAEFVADMEEAGLFVVRRMT